MTQSVVLMCAVIVCGVWLALRPLQFISLVERLNHAKWQNPNAGVIRIIGALSALSTGYYLFRLLWRR